MKQEMTIGEYTKYDKKVFRCVADNHSTMKRCILCDLRQYGLCNFVCCQPDEREDGKAVIFKLTRKYRQVEDAESLNKEKIVMSKNKKEHDKERNITSKKKGKKV